MYKTVQINCFRKVFCMTAFPCVSTSVPIDIRVSIRVRGLHLVHYGATRLLERLLWMWGQALRDSDHVWLNALHNCAGSVDSVDMLCWEKNWLTEGL